MLIDEMWPSTIAAQLRLRGHDVAAVVERSDLRSKPDEYILTVAQREWRVLVSENANDFRKLASVVIQGGNRHPGFVFTTERRVPRHDARVVGRLITALDALLITDIDLTNSEHWLR
jgi:hypothetical protein